MKTDTTEGMTTADAKALAADILTRASHAPKDDKVKGALLILPPREGEFKPRVNGGTYPGAEGIWGGREEILASGGFIIAPGPVADALRLDCCRLAAFCQDTVLFDCPSIADGWLVRHKGDLFIVQARPRGWQARKPYAGPDPVTAGYKRLANYWAEGCGIPF